MKKFTIFFVFAMVSLGVMAQEERNFLQTDVLAPIARLPSVNIGYVRYSPNKKQFLEVGLNFFIYLPPVLSEPGWELNYYSVENINFPSNQITIGYRWITENKKTYVGTELQYGLLMFKNKQIVATELQNNGGFLRVSKYDNNTFTSYNHKLSGLLSIGRIIPLKNGTSFDFNFKMGFYYFLRNANGHQENIADPNYRTDLPLPDNWEINHWLTGNAANLDGIRNYGLIFRLGLSYRFIKF